LPEIQKKKGANNWVRREFPGGATRVAMTLRGKKRKKKCQKKRGEKDRGRRKIGGAKFGGKVWKPSVIARRIASIGTAGDR